MVPINVTMPLSLANVIRRLTRLVRVSPERMTEARVTVEQLRAIRALFPVSGPLAVPYERGAQADETGTCDLDVAGALISTYTTGYPHITIGKLWLWTVDQDGRGIRTVDGGAGVVGYPATNPQPISHQAAVSWTTPPSKISYGPGEWSLVGRD